MEDKEGLDLRIQVFIEVLCFLRTIPVMTLEEIKNDTPFIVIKLVEKDHLLISQLCRRQPYNGIKQFLNVQLLTIKTAVEFSNNIWICRLKDSPHHFEIGLQLLERYRKRKEPNNPVE